MQKYKTIKTKAEMRMLVKEIVDNMTPQARELYAKLKQQCQYRQEKVIEENKTPGLTKKQKDFAFKTYMQAYNELYNFEKNYGIFKIGFDFYRTQCIKVKGNTLMEPINYNAKPKKEKVVIDDEVGF